MFQPDQISRVVHANARLAEEIFSTLEAGSRDEPGLTRDTYGAGENFAHGVLADYGKKLNLELKRDAAANTYLTLRGKNPHAKKIIIGSHLDSVPHGGNYDGAAGVVAGLVSVAALKQLGLEPECDVTVMAVRAEESVWFEVSYIGSRSALATLPPDALEAKRIDTGRTLAQHLVECGGDPEAVRRGESAIQPDKVRAFIEVHIEQAPSLVNAGVPVAICSGIPGNFRYPNVRVEGEYAHVGQPRRFRHDAVIAASEFAVALDRLWQEYEDAGQPMACTLGRFHTNAAAHHLTKVAGELDFSLDVRGYDEKQLADVERRVLAIIADIERARGVKFHMGRRASAPVGQIDPGIRKTFERGAGVLRIATMPLGSPASHDAAAFADAKVPTGMLFVRNENGSHNPNEAMAIDDFMQAATLLTWWVTDTCCSSR
ncbi:MAG TPA: hydantoinase/carbamoylase family amidase [Lacipirellulaceae bacterium]|nr:hydantoinase/carbamoylase family amidase [Lacipirellulaceae bacterium]